MEKNKKLNIMLFAHHGYLNRGCEAIIQGTNRILKKEFKELSFLIASYSAQTDGSLKIPNVDRYISHQLVERATPKWALGVFYRKILNNPVGFQKIVHQNVINESKNVDACFSIGGDNYCYGTPNWLYAINQGIKKNNKKLVLWGASIDPERITQAMKNDLQLFDLMVIRESITYEALQERNIDKNLVLCPDPAFVMEKEELPLPKGWLVGNTIGFNLSPLVMNYANNSETLLKSAYQFIDYIIKKTDSNIALIPHVTWEKDNDFVPLQNIYNNYKETNRVILIDSNYTAPQYKGFIARCRFFIGARTHATIAAYSSGVPTLVIGYSVKSRGIAKDLFGESDLVLPVQKLTDEKQLIKSFESLKEQEKEIKKQLEKLMPDYCAKADSASQYIRKLIG